VLNFKQKLDFLLTRSVDIMCYWRIENRG